ncbi:MAG: DUF1007 family protein [Hyphomicrobium sp.]|mgnify:CR=1 FL=1|nr:DUF1007 family protein [Hyphomicrobium sp.]
MKRTTAVIARVGASVAALTGFWAPSASAHPHVWVTYETTIVYDKGTVTGVEHVWSFDDMYTAMAIQGLDKNNDGTYDREELAELAQVNMDGLKDFDYFTFAKLGGADLKFAGPKDAWLEHTNGILRLHFKLPLASPVLAEAEGLNFSIYDPSFFIAFEPEKTDALKLASAPEGCTAAFIDPAADKSAEDTKKLGEAFFQELGGQNFGMSQAKTVAITCKKS